MKRNDLMTYALILEQFLLVLIMFVFLDCPPQKNSYELIRTPWW